MRLIVVGATGTSGGEVVRQALEDTDITEVIAIVRRPLGFSHQKLKIIEHQDYLHYSSLMDVFKNADACAWCLGVSQTQVSREQLHIITYDFALAAAKAMREANPNITFLFQSGAGADSNETSSIPFEMEKGKTENALKTLGFKKLYIVRPAGIQPIHLNKNTALVNKLVAPFYPLIKLFIPSLVITSAELAKAILYILKNGNPKTILENIELKNIGNGK